MDRKKLLDTIKGFTMYPASLRDVNEAIVTAGGVSVKEVNPKTMESKLVSGLFIIGELLDIDGICGGYNLTFAILTGFKAGKSINVKN